MPRIDPFRALLYGPRLRPRLDDLVAPPYDVLTGAEREALAGRHPRNIVHLDLPQAADGDPYRDAAARLRAWVEAGDLARDDRPAFYACEQRFRSGPVADTVRRGFFARLTLEPFESGVVIPHEKTLERPRTDRQQLLAATRTHLSAVFMLHPDPGGEVAGVLDEALRGGDLLMADEPGGGAASRVARVDDERRIGTLAARLRDSWALIADGHHRYESALAYRDARRAEGRRDAETVLVFLCSLEDPGLAIRPIHRLVRAPDGFDPQRFLAALRDLFDLQAVATEETLGAALAGRRGKPGTFGLALRGTDGYLVAHWREGAGLDRPEMAAVPPPLRRLDVILLHRLVLEGILGISPEAQARQTNLEYVKDDALWFARAREPRVDVAVLMNPTRMDQVIEVTRSGLRLPQKSTYFHPKILTGLVLDPLD
jgi:uncharacterized protein (DUF1015 family)